MATPAPHPGIGVKAPLVPPAPGQVIVGYTIIEPETGCCKCDDLTGGGLALLIIGILIFWPIALIPCFMADFKKKSQVPVYGYPGGAPVAMPVGAPPPGAYGAPPPVNYGYPPQPAKV